MTTMPRFGQVFVLTLLMAGSAHAQTSFPDHAIRILVGFGAGGASDIGARAIAKKMSEELGQQVIVENKPGASTSIAGNVVAKAEPDGYTLFQAGNANAVNAIVTPKPPFEILTDFTPVGSQSRHPAFWSYTHRLGYTPSKN
jgi:tripartite-type tricarboxylate transporter receptor subunit TctC